MNYVDIQERCWSYLGFPDGSVDDRNNWRLQAIRDAINNSYAEIMTKDHIAWRLIREADISTTSGTSVYQINDFCNRPNRFWTEDDNGGEIKFISRKDGQKYLMNSAVQGSSSRADYIIPSPVTTTAGKTITCSINEADQTLTRSSGDSFASTDVGSMVRIKGEGGGYEIQTFTDTDNVELNKPYLTRVTGRGSTAGGNLSNIEVEVSPPGRYQIEIVPANQITGTIKCEYYRYVDPLVNDTDTPYHLPEQYHHAILYGALAEMDWLDESGRATDWKKLQLAVLSRIEAEEADSGASFSQMDYEGFHKMASHYGHPVQPDQYGRGLPFNWGGR